jgi:hypothetical protein
MLSGVACTACTVSVALPLTLPEAAEIIVLPTPRPVAKPPEPTVATAGLEEFHVTEPVRFRLEPSE